MIDSIAYYHEHGIVRLPNVFTKEEVDKIRASALMSLRKPLQLQERDVDGVVFPALLFWPAKEDAYLNQIRTDARLATIVKQFLGPNVKQLNNQIYYRLPGDKDQFAWHQDVTFRTPAHEFPGVEDKYLQTIIVVDPINEDNAAVEFIPGTHKQGDLGLIGRDGMQTGLREFKRLGKQGIKLYANPGDVLIWSVMIVHGSEENLSSTMRMTYMNGFAASDAAPNYPMYLKDGDVVPTIDPDARTS